MYAKNLFVVSLLASVLSATPVELAKRGKDGKGFPGDGVQCSVQGGFEFSEGFLKETIEDYIPTVAKAKGKYPEEFQSGSPGAGAFSWQNDCASKGTIWALPLTVRDGKATKWSDSKVGKSNPGPYRVYFTVETKDDDDWDYYYCGAYEHIDDKDMSKFGPCTEK